jgi:hypothetical protein
MQLTKLASDAFISTDYGKDSSKPIVIVAGFMDGSARIVMKYAEIYDRIGFTVVILISTSLHLAFLPIWLVHRGAAMKLKTLIQGRPLNVECRDTMLHALDYHLGGLTISALFLDLCRSVPDLAISGSDSIFPRVDIAATTNLSAVGAW